DINLQITLCGSTNPVPSYPLPVSGGPWAHAGFGVTSNFLYIGGVGMFRGTFIQGTGFVYSATLCGIHSDFQCVVPDPAETDGVFLCNDGGVFHDSPATSPRSLSKTLGLTQIYRMDVHKLDGGILATGEQDNGNRVSFARTNSN